MRALHRFGWVLILACLGGGHALAEPLTFSGKVVDAAGNPVADARILSVAYKGRALESVDLTTDANGAFTFQSDAPPFGPPGGRRGILASKAGLAMALIEGLPGVPLTLKLLDRPEPRGGVLLTPEGRPIPSGTVTVNWLFANGVPNTPAGPLLPGELTADDQGRFRFEGFGPGMGLAITIEADGYASSTGQIMDANPLALTLAPEATISGRVLVNGQPQGGLALNAGLARPGGPMRGATTRTNPDGTYTLRGLSAGAFYVSVLSIARMATPPQQQVSVKAGQAVTGIDFNFTSGALIRGKVTDEKTGQAVPEADVAVMTAEGRTGGYVQSDAAGKYEVRVPPGSYHVNASLRSGPGFMITSTRGGATFPGAVAITAKDGDVLEGQDLKVRLPRTVRGQVLLPDGQPATGAKVAYMGGFAGRPTLELDKEARFELTVPDVAPRPDQGLMGSSPFILATEPERNLAAIYNQSPLPDDFTIKLQPAGTVTFVITDEQNQPLKGFGMLVGYPLGDRGSLSQGAVKSDDLGLIRLACLPANVKLRLFPDQTLRQLMVNQDKRELEVTLQPGEERTLPPIIVNPNGRSLNVFVGDADGKPMKGAQVYAPGLESSALTGADGKVTLTKLPLKGKVLLVAMHPTQEWYAAESVDPDGGVWPGLLLKPLGKATGMLVAKPGGKPLEGYQVRCQANVELWRMGNEVQQRLSRWTYGGAPAKTDDQGRWHAENLIPGLEYSVYASREDGRGFGGRNTFKAAGGDSEQDVGIMECDVPDGQ